jgi:hypothetical protein
MPSSTFALALDHEPESANHTHTRHDQKVKYTRGQARLQSRWTKVHASAFLGAYITWSSLEEIPAANPPQSFPTPPETRVNPDLVPYLSMIQTLEPNSRQPQAACRHPQREY